MKMSQPEQQAITSLMTRIYTEIREIEETYQLWVGQGDFRARIEYFHDAVRAFTSPPSPANAARLSVEFLAYDLSCLRYLQSMPLASFKPSAAPLIPKNALVPTSQTLAEPLPKPDRDTKQRLADTYQYYTVLFAALFKPVADRDFQSKVDENNQQVEDIESLIHSLEQMMQGKGSAHEAFSYAEHLDDPAFTQALRDYLSQGRKVEKPKLQAMVQTLKDRSKNADKEIHRLDEAHANYGMNQLAIYENGKEIVKKMGEQGMNLAGKFVESSMTAARRTAGRGR